MSTRLTVATSYTIDPPRGGGQQRIVALYGALARLGFTVEVVTLADRGERASRREIAPGLVEIRVPRSARHESVEHALGQRAGVPAGDIALTLHHDLTPAYGEAIAASAIDAAAIVASHPFALPAIEAATDAPLIYEAHNVEADLKVSMFAPAAEDLVAAVADVEARCCDLAELVLACSPDDAGRLRERYAAEAVVVPNGVDVGARRFVPLAERRASRARLGLAGTPTALFVGSWHEPNLRAARTVLGAAERSPGVRFLLVGSVGKGLGRTPIPENVDVCGPVEAGFLDAVLAIADVALNPMHAGSGTNLKMLDYAAAGVPLVASPIGARGLGFTPGVHYHEAAADPEALAAAIAAVLAEDEDVLDARTRAARERTEAGFDWAAIARRWAEHPYMRDLAGAVPA
jgi:glycosyltransferase involved in cell wall biosynthesis